MSSVAKYTLVYQLKTDEPIQIHTNYYGDIQSFIKRKQLTEHDYMLFRKPPLEGKMHKQL